MKNKSTSSTFLPITLTVPEELKAEMDEFPQANWSEIFREAVQILYKIQASPTSNIEMTLKDLRMGYYGEEPGLILRLDIKSKKCLLK